MSATSNYSTQFQRLCDIEVYKRAMSKKTVEKEGEGEGEIEGGRRGGREEIEM